jgi:hypothetical protein
MEITHEQLAMLIEEHRRAGLPLFVDGATGIGKSEAGIKSSKVYSDKIGRQWVAWVDLSNAERHKFLDDKELVNVHLFVDIRTALLEPTDLLGLPFKDERGYVAWLPTLLFKILSSAVVSATIFFDEFNLGSLMVMKSSYQLILDKAIGEIKLGKDVTILAAGNRIEDRANVTESPAPLNNRFSHCTLLCPTPDEWITYNLKSDCPEPRLVAFIKFKPKYIFDFKPNQKEKAFPTPRALQQLAMLIKGKNEMNELDLMTMLAMAKCGEAFGAEFQSFLRLTRQVNVDEILEHPEKVHEFEKQLDLKYSLISGVAVRVKQDFSKMEKALKVIAELEDEYGVFLLRMIIDICGMKVLSFLEHSPTWETKLYDKFKDILSTRFAQVS